MKQTIPVVLLLAGAVALGLWMAWQFLQRRRTNPMHIGFHVILGLASLEAVAMLTRGGLDGQATMAGFGGKNAALVLALAVITGFATSLVARRWSRGVGSTALAAHAALGAAGFVMFLAWAFNL